MSTFNAADVANSIEENRAQRIANRKANSSESATPSTNALAKAPDYANTAKEDGYRNNLERSLGTEEYERIGARGHDDPDNKGRYSAREVISEVRNRDGKTVEEMSDYFEGLRADGVKFNKRAEKYLDRIAGESGGGDGGSTGFQSPEMSSAKAFTRAHEDYRISGDDVQSITGYNPVTGDYGFNKPNGQTAASMFNDRYKAQLKYELNLQPDYSSGLVWRGGEDDEQDDQATMPMQ